MSTSATPVPSPSESALNCSSFSCLLSKFDLLKTSKGYILNQEEEEEESKEESDQECDFHCWIEKFQVNQTKITRNSSNTPKNKFYFSAVLVVFHH